MMFQHNESVASRRDVFVRMFDGVDGVTPKTGLSPVVEMVKSGGDEYAACGATVLEIGAGTYRIRMSVVDLDTLGAAMLKVSAAGATVEYVPIQVVRFMDEVHLAKAALANARSHDVASGVDQIKDDDGETVLRTFTPTESDGVISLVVS